MADWLERGVVAGGVASLLATVACHTSAAATTSASSSAALARCGDATTSDREVKPLELTVLGSGGPRSAGRAASSYLFRVNGTPRILVDVGPGSFARIGEIGLPADRLDTILLTHLHIDHAGDLAALVKSRDLSADGPVSFTVVGPDAGGPYPSTTAFLEHLFGPNGAYAYLPSFRNQLRLNGKDVRLEVNAPPEHILELNGVTIRVIAVDHGDVPAVAYRLDGGGRSFVVSGDLASTRSRIEEFARGADVLVYDTAVLDPPGSPQKLYELHTPPSRIGEIAAGAGVSVLVLGHIPPKVEERRDEVLASIRRSFHGEVRFAHDCMHVNLGDGS